MLKCHFSTINPTWNSGIEPGPPQWQADDKAPYLSPNALLGILHIMKLKSEASINWHIVIFVEDNSLCLLLNKLHLFSTTQHRFIVIQLLHLHVAHMFRRVLRPSSDKEIQKPYKIFLCMVFIVIVYSSVRFLYWHAWGWPKYRPKHVAHMFRPVLRPSSDMEIQKPYKIFLCMVFCCYCIFLCKVFVLRGLRVA